jgi:hypothetical protein
MMLGSCAPRVPPSPQFAANPGAEAIADSTMTASRCRPAQRADVRVRVAAGIAPPLSIHDLTLSDGSLLTIEQARLIIAGLWI